MPDAAPLACPHCGASLPVDQVNIARLIAVCPACAHAVDLATEVLDRPALPDRLTPPEALMEMMSGPAGVTVHKSASSLEIRRRWFEPSAIGLAAFALFWDSVLAVIYATLLVGDASRGAPAFALFFPLLHVAAGLALTWVAAARLLNTSRVNLAGGRLTVTHGPLMWPAPEPIDTESIDQLYVVRHRRARGALRFDLLARMQDGTAVKLLGSIRQLAQARFIEHRVEAWLGISDQPVRDEYEG